MQPSFGKLSSYSALLLFLSSNRNKISNYHHLQTKNLNS